MNSWILQSWTELQEKCLKVLTIVIYCVDIYQIYLLLFWKTCLQNQVRFPFNVAGFFIRKLNNNNNNGILLLESLVEPVTFHNLLEQSAVDIVDKLIFDYNIETGVLEKKAQQLGFNLSASLIAGCCPKIPQLLPSIESTKCPSSDRIVLNELIQVSFIITNNTCVYKINKHKINVLLQIFTFTTILFLILQDYKSLPPSNPNEVVERILSELLIAFQTYSQNKQRDGNISEKNLLTESDIIELRHDMKIQKILEKTLEINFVKLQSLSESETILFFLNLLNLIMCHCYLSIKLEESDGVYSKYAFYREVGFAFLGYKIGDLGFMSVADIKQKLFGKNYSSKFSPRCQKSWDWLQIQPNPILLFASINFKSSSPPLILYKITNFQNQISDNVRNYIRNLVSVEGNEVTISNLLDQYVNAFLLPQTSDDTNGSEKDINEKTKLLMKFLLDNCSGDFGDAISNIPLSGK